MNLNVLHDAIGKIDEDLIEEVDALRRKPRQTIVWIWVQRASVVAACVAVLVVGVVALSHIGLLPTFSVTNDGNLSHMYDDADQAIVENDTASSEETLQADEYTYYAPTIEAIKEAALTVEITAWTDMGCLATILENEGDHDNIHSGDTVEIVFTENIITLFSFDGMTIFAAERAPTPTEFPIGTTAFLWEEYIEATDDTAIVHAYCISPAYETE